MGKNKYARQQQWSEKNLKRITISLRKNEYENLETYCEKNNITKTNLIKERLKDIIY